MGIEEVMAAQVQEWLEGVCNECHKRPAYDGDYCEECQFERTICRAEMIGDEMRGH